MGKSKPFIDKKKATTYSLVFNTGVDEPAEPSASVSDRPRFDINDLPPGIGEEEAAWFASMMGAGNSSYHDQKYALTEEERKEMVDLGFPDDGYNYLRHLKELVPGKAPAESSSEQPTASDGPVGPCVFIPAPKFVPPAADVKLVDARQLAVGSIVEDDAAAMAKLETVSAFSKPTQLRKGKLATEITEVQQSIAELEDDEADAADDFGDWLDTFVAEAAVDKTAKDLPSEGASAQAKPADGELDEGDEEADGETDEYDEVTTGSCESDEEVGELGPDGTKRPYAGSIASTYWRPERTDRQNLLNVVDEQFENLALEYDDDDVGELDDDDEEARGEASLDQYAKVLEEFTQQIDTDVTAHHELPGGRSNKVASFDEVDEEVIQKTKSALQRVSEAKDEEPVSTVLVHSLDPADQWDCESVLSLRSNLDNHPGKIVEPSNKKKYTPAMGGIIELSSKTGLPAGYGVPNPCHPAATSSHEEEGEDDQEGSEDLQRVNLVRPKNETPEEKKARKAAVKEMRRSARAAKKEVKTLYKTEATVQKKQHANSEKRNTIPLA